MKHAIDKTRLAESMQRTSLAVIMLEISVWLTPFAKQNELIRYIRQGTYAVTVLLAVRAVLSLRRLIPKTMRRDVLDRLLFSFRKLASGVAFISKKLLSLVGVSFDRSKRRKDEKSFIFGEEDDDLKRKKRHSVKSSSRWRDTEDNAEKIRFLYVKYIVKIIKRGYKFRTVMTPNELKEDIGADGEGEELFELYNGARYSGGSVFITDEQVEKTVAFVNDKKK